MIGDIWYRYYSHHSNNHTTLLMTRYVVVRETERTVWVVEKDLIYPSGQWLPETAKRILKDATKQYAKPTQGMALTSFRRRKALQIAHLEATLRGVREAVELSKIGRVTDDTFTFLRTNKPEHLWFQEA